MIVHFECATTLVPQHQNTMLQMFAFCIFNYFRFFLGFRLQYNEKFHSTIELHSYVCNINSSKKKNAHFNVIYQMAMTNLKSSLRYFMGFCLFLFRVLLFSCIPLLFSWKPSTRKTRLERGSIQSSGKSERDRRWKRTRVNNGKQNSHVMFELCVYVICVSIYFHYIHSYLLKPSCCRRCGLLFWWLATRKQCYSFRSFHSLSLSSTLSFSCISVSFFDSVRSFFIHPGYMFDACFHCVFGAFVCLLFLTFSLRKNNTEEQVWEREKERAHSKNNDEEKQKKK